MKSHLAVSFLLLLVISIAISVVWYMSYLPIVGYQKPPVSFTALLKHSNVTIQDNNFSCEAEDQKTVGTVIGSILEYNQKHSRNLLTFSCNNSHCWLSVSDCKPWQYSECGSRILSFKYDSENNIDATSFECIDVP